MDGAPCCEPNCESPADMSGRCWAHWKRRERGQSASATVRKQLSREARLWEAFYASLEIDEFDDEAWERARARVRMAALRFAVRGKGSRVQDGADS
jgi:hypothetical protein